MSDTGSPEPLVSNLKAFFLEKIICQEAILEFLCICTSVLYEYMNLLRNDVYNLFVNTHMRIKIYQEFYHSII